MFKLPDNPHPQEESTEIFNAWQECGEAYLKALIKFLKKELITWLFEKCTEHLLDEYECGKPVPLKPQIVWTSKGLYYIHRYLCPQCMQQLKEWGEK